MTYTPLLAALSSFWHQFFADLGDVEALYEGTENLAGQLYLDLLHELLGTAVVDQRLTRRESARFWRLKATDARHTHADGWHAKGPVDWARVGFLQDALAVPSKVLDATVDFDTREGRIHFYAAPATALVGFPRRKVSTEIGGYVTFSGTGLDLAVAGDKLTATGDGREYVVLGIDDGKLLISPATPVSTDASSVAVTLLHDGLTYTGTASFNKAARIGVTEYAVWALDGEVDDHLLYRSAGFLVGEQRPSTEAYRSFVRGVMQLHMLSPAPAAFEAAMNVIAGLPVVRSSGETVLTVENGAAFTTVTTDQGVYRLPSNVPKHPAIVTGAVLRAGQSLGRAVAVEDTGTNPTWWYGARIPRALAPQLTASARLATAALYETKVGDAYRWSVGDPTVTVGGELLGDGVTRSAWHRSTAFYLMQTYLARHMFGVYLDGSLETTPGTVERLRSLIPLVKPANTLAYIWGTDNLVDSAAADDNLYRTAKLQTGDTFSGDIQWVIGAGSEIGKSLGPGARGVAIGGEYPYATRPEQTIGDEPVVITPE